MRAETRPVGRWAVERVHVSGCGMDAVAAEVAAAAEEEGEVLEGEA